MKCGMQISDCGMNLENFYYHLLRIPNSELRICSGGLTWIYLI
jgi:hypothetical protein